MFKQLLLPLPLPVVDARVVVNEGSTTILVRVPNPIVFGELGTHLTALLKSVYPGGCDLNLTYDVVEPCCDDKK